MSSDPVALAALEALLSDSESESSSVGSNSSASRPGGDAANDNDSDDGVGALDMAIEYEIQYDNDSKNRINDDDDSPTTLKMESNYNDDDSNDSDSSYEYQHYRKRYPLYHLKPFFDVGTSVYAPWWDDRVQKEYCDTFYPGTITSYKEIASSSPYGPLRLYTIVYEDGDHLEDVQDHFVFSKADYLVHHRPLRGVRCEVDGRYADDKWASIVGYYVVTIDGEDMKFASLVDAMDAYDKQVIQQMGTSNVKVKPTDLNRPECYPELSKKSTANKIPRSTSSKKKPRSTLPPGLSSSSSSSSESSSTTPKASPQSKNLPPGFSSSSGSDSSEGPTVQFNTRRRTSSISTSKSASTAPKPTRQPKSSLSSTSSTSPETAPTQRKSLKKKKSPESEASVVVTPKTLPRKRQKKSPLPPASKYQGVSYSKDDKKYLAQIEYNHKFHSLGVYKFEADAALAYDMGYKLLLKHPQDDVASAAAVAAPHAASRNFVRRESYEDNIREAMKNANRKRINVEKSYSKVSDSVGVYVSKIFAAEENKLRESLDNEKSGDDDNTDFENATTNHGNVDTSTEFEFTISAPRPSTSSQRNTMTKNKKLRDSLDDFQSGDDVDDLEHALNNNDDGGFNASTEFEDFEFTISTPATTMETAVETNIEHDDGTIARLRVEENSVPSPQCKTIMKTHACSSVEYDQICKRFIAYIVLPKSEIKYSLGEYKLEADAAYACDKAATLLQVETLTNFSTWEKYKATQQNELDTKKCSFAVAMPSLEIATQVYDNLLHHMKNRFDAITEKCVQNGKVLSDDYKSHIHNILNGRDGRNEVCCDDDVLEEADDIASIHSDGRGGEDSDEDDDASLFSDSSHMTPQGCL